MQKNIDKAYLLKHFNNEIVAFESKTLTELEKAVKKVSKKKFPILELFDHCPFAECSHDFLYFTKNNIDSYAHDENGESIIELKDIQSCRLEIRGRKGNDLIDCVRFDDALILTIDFCEESLLKDAIGRIFFDLQIWEEGEMPLALLSYTNNPTEHLSVECELVRKFLSKMFWDIGVMEEDIKSHREVWVRKISAVLQKMNCFQSNYESDIDWSLKSVCASEYKKAKQIEERFTDVLKKALLKGEDRIALHDLFYGDPKKDGGECIPICAFLHCFLMGIGLDIDLDDETFIAMYDDGAYFSCTLLSEDNVLEDCELEIHSLDDLAESLYHNPADSGAVRAILNDYIYAWNVDIKSSVFGDGNYIVCCKDLSELLFD